MASNLRRRTAGLLVGAALSAASLTACGVSPSTVATVGDQTITQKEYQSGLDDAYADPIVGAQAKELGSAYRTAYLSDLVSYEIAMQVAKKAGVSVTDADVDAKLKELLGGQDIQVAQEAQAQQGDPTTPDQLRMRVARSLVSAKLGEKATGATKEAMAAEQLAQLKAQRDADPGQYTKYDMVLTATADQALAADWTAKANGGMSLPDAVASNPDPSTPPGNQATGEESITGADLAQQPDVLKQIQAVPVGQTGVVTQGPDQTGAFTYVVLTLKAATLTTDEELQTQANQAADQQFLQAGMAEAAAQSKKVKVEVNERYGKVERPAEGLPSVTVPTPDTFSAPSAKKDQQQGTTPVIPTG